MIVRIRVSGGLSACFLLWVMSGEASGDSAASIFQMPFDELLALQVVTPSKFAENPATSPNVVSNLTAREIELFGGRDLGEVPI